MFLLSAALKQHTRTFCWIKKSPTTLLLQIYDLEISYYIFTERVALNANAECLSLLRVEPEHSPRCSQRSVQMSNLKRQGKAQSVATNSPMAVTHLFERLMQTQGEGDGFFPLPTVSGADAGERFWTSQEVKYECGCGCVCVCVHKTSVHRVLEFH